jgi:hypothetical protein
LAVFVAQNNLDRLRQLEDIANAFGLRIGAVFGLLQNLNVGLVLDKVEFRTEQQHPLLLLPDHIAGCLQCEVGVPDSDLPAALDRDTVTTLAKRLRSSSQVSVLRREFDLIYKRIFGNL